MKYNQRIAQELERLQFERDDLKRRIEIVDASIALLHEIVGGVKAPLTDHEGAKSTKGGGDVVCNFKPTTKEF